MNSKAQQLQAFMTILFLLCSFATAATFLPNESRSLEQTNPSVPNFKEYKFNMIMGARQDERENLEFMIHQIKRPDEDCSHSKCFIGYLESFTIPSDDMHEEGYPAGDGEKPVFRLGVSSKTNYTVTFSDQLSEYFKEFILMACEKLNPYVTAGRTENSVPIPEIEDDNATVMEDTENDEDGDIDRSDNTLNFSSGATDSYGEGEDNQNLVDIKGFIEVKVTLESKYQDAEKLAHLEAVLNLQTRYLVHLTPQDIQNMRKEEDQEGGVDEDVPEYSMDPEGSEDETDDSRVLQEDDSARFLQSSSRTQVFASTKRIVNKRVMNRRLTADFEVKCYLLYRDGEASDINCQSNIHYVLFGKSKRIRIFDNTQKINRIYKNVINLRGGFAKNIRVRFPPPFLFISFNFHISLTYYVIGHIQSKLISESRPFQVEILTTLTAGARTSASVNIRFGRILRVGVVLSVTLFEITTDPTVLVTIPVQNRICTKVDWDYEWAAFHGYVELYYQIIRIRIRRWKLRISWRAPRTIRRWDISGRSGRGTILNYYRCFQF